MEMLFSVGKITVVLRLLASHVYWIVAFIRVSIVLIRPISVNQFINFWALLPTIALVAVLISIQSTRCLYKNRSVGSNESTK